MITVISTNNMSFLKEKARTPQEIIAFLKQDAIFRDFGYVLRQYCEGDDLTGRLSRTLSEMNGEEYDKTVRKVRNWVNGKNTPKNRETLFQICFALKLDEAAADRLLASASDTGIHYRNPEELIYAYALRKGCGYDKAIALRKQIFDRLGWKNGEFRKGRKEIFAGVYTEQIKDAFEDVDSEQELFQFFDEQHDHLGYLHETAYRKFIELLSYLQQPAGLETEFEEKYTMGEVVKYYISMHISEQTDGRYSVLQKLVKKYWPNETSLLKMKNRQEDVSRKVIILLYMITQAFDDENINENEDYYMDEDLEDDADTLLEIRIEKMNLFLNTYGMNLLDPGSPFDFLVLYAMKTADGEYVSDKMEQVLAELFECSEV